VVRVGFTFEMTGSWLGGANYFRSLVAALLAVPGRSVEPVIFAGTADVAGLKADFPGVDVVATGLFVRRAPAWILRKLVLRLTGLDSGLQRLLRKHGIAVLSHSGALGPGATIPAIGWIADLQHRRLPELCSPAESAARDATIERWHRHCAALVFSSHSARSDFERFYGKARIPVFVIPFVPLTRPVDPLVVERVGGKYGLRDKYFFVPNQFWSHKNHRLVIEAALLLKAEGLEINLVFSGGAQDYRHTGHYARLVELASALGERARFLGVVPYEDVLALMERAIAVINPSLFEGWSTTVEEARNLGKSILLSDIDVHREQAPPRGVYFKPDDAVELADRMRQAWHGFDGPEEHRLRRVHAPDVAARRLAFGQAFQAAVLAVHEGHSCAVSAEHAVP
jgi:glycosyltransferase involved in cell wall biosynthesis